jgi:hypothetical protein
MAEIQYPVALRFDFVVNTKAKAAGAQWNPTLNQWEALGVLWKREWLDVPSICIKRAKMFNARFDPKFKCWYDPFGSASQSAVMLNPYRLRRQSY